MLKQPFEDCSLDMMTMTGQSATANKREKTMKKSCQ